MRRIEGREISGVESDVFSLMKEIYRHSRGEYPALEWVKDRPLPDEPGWEERFEAIYRPFMRYRLKEDVDILLVEGGERITGMIGIKHTHTGSFPGYVRLFSHIGLSIPDNAAFLEMLAVHPEHRGEGMGKRLLLAALKELDDVGMKGYGVSFPGLHPALELYESIGARVIADVKGYSWSDEDEPADYVVIEFPRNPGKT